MPPEPTQVWLVKEGDPTAIEGTLAIVGPSLVFTPLAGGAASVIIPLGEILGARRHRGAPLMKVSVRTTEGKERLFVYFAKPPPLPGARPSSPLPLFRWPRGLERSAAALALRATSRLLKREIEAWVRALREAGG